MKFPGPVVVFNTLTALTLLLLASIIILLVVYGEYHAPSDTWYMPWTDPSELTVPDDAITIPQIQSMLDFCDTKLVLSQERRDQCVSDIMIWEHLERNRG